MSYWSMIHCVVFQLKIHGIVSRETVIVLEHLLYILVWLNLTLQHAIEELVGLELLQYQQVPAGRRR